MTTALGIAPDSAGKGVDPLTHRKVLQSHWASVGIVTGLGVSGRSDLKYNVAAGVAVCSRGSADGYTEAYFGGGATAAVSAGDPSNPRVDRIWIKARDLTQGDADNQVVIGVTQGTPSASPVAPSTPAGCVRLLDMTLPAGATSTQKATPPHSADYAIPYGVSVGVLATANVNQQYEIPEDKQWKKRVSVRFTVQTDRTVNIKWKARASCGSDNSNMASYFVQLRVDGSVINSGVNLASSWIQGAFDEIGVLRFAETKGIDYDVIANRGTHTAEVYVLGNPAANTAPVTLYGIQNLTVTDRGVFR
ncbi:hypothetical protein [Bifidobacterium panos]|uniref:Uncharacterized protein n=1 Tax=Bifidobacterium panos TaxID=2675321 RepID=A0ABX1SY74_9BIFI|nr:hypothetical protein [Bifidobacterium sp. DSM 109963]NMN02791.1 hypothetical protein [Bifidobacterium sp. DSM 109963]